MNDDSPVLFSVGSICVRLTHLMRLKYKGLTVSVFDLVGNLPDQRKLFEQSNHLVPCIMDLDYQVSFPAKMIFLLFNPLWAGGDVHGRSNSLQ